ncbi:hypothetical protein IE53DRAFT_133820 [Violaceomyces palustris]|uniref:Uncharacterized protein n=1 Tax=Violaceomyces palustris TaxID=1673888 RepID=A0ACD0P6E7_9BASI|nr:hypothetical protein IE53DRAFT_133820 [Violaceomyces palustris]
MLHSRAFALNENQPFSIQARTPGPSGSHLSSIRKKAMTTGKRPTLGGENPGGFPVDAGAIGPKQLFKDFMGSKTPARGALGDRTNKTPGPSSVCFRNQEGGKGSDNSPLKAMKPSTGKVRKSLTRSPSKGSSLRQSPTKSSTLPANPDQSYMTDVSTAMTPVPSASTLKERILSRQNSFVTPAANIGRAGQMKAMMGEMKDAEMGFKVADGDGADLDHANGQVKEMTDEEMYPEIEYMPPSHYAYNIPYYFPEELENLPRAAEIGQMLASFRPLGFHGRDESSKEAEDRKVQTLDLPSDPELDPANLSSDDDSGVDELWPDVAIATNSIPATTPGQRVETTSLQRRFLFFFDSHRFGDKTFDQCLN